VPQSFLVNDVNVLFSTRVTVLKGCLLKFICFLKFSSKGRPERPMVSAVFFHKRVSVFKFSPSRSILWVLCFSMNEWIPSFFPLGG
jgi:hypothetical protein